VGHGLSLLPPTLPHCYSFPINILEVFSFLEKWKKDNRNCDDDSMVWRINNMVKILESQCASICYFGVCYVDIIQSYLVACVS
jgi:hypothetical protein